MSADQSTLQHAIQALRNGDRVAARTALHQFTTDHPLEVDGWLWLAAATDDLADKRTYLQQTLALQPEDRRVVAALRTLDGAPAAAATVTTPLPITSDTTLSSHQPAAAVNEAETSRNPLVVPRFVPTGVRTRRPIPWRLIALASAILMLLVPLTLLLVS